MCAFGGIFQDKVDKLFGDIDGVKIFIYDILFFIKYSAPIYI